MLPCCLSENQTSHASVTNTVWANYSTLPLYMSEILVLLAHFPAVAVFAFLNLLNYSE